MVLPSGTKLGPYEIVAPIGAGGMGEVYRARDPQLSRDVAIKILPASLSRDPDRLRRFEQEARAAAALNHPNILAVYQFGTHDGAPYLVSELLEGSTLRDQFLRGPLPIRKAVDYAIQTAHGLAAAHEKGIVHRDLKPENLFLTRDGRIKILDFGLAKLVAGPAPGGPDLPTMSEGTEPGVVLGTVGYMSPEQVRGEAADHRADLFAFGAILYEMLTGKRSFRKPTSAETMTAILNEELPPVSQVVPGIPPALQRVVQRCLEKSPGQRFHSASDLAFALEALSDAGSAQAGTLVAPISHGRLPWIVAIAGAVVVLVAVAWWIASPPPPPVIESVVQLTDDRQAKTGLIETDGARLFFNEGPVGSFRIAQVSVHGGQTADVPSNLLNPQIMSLARDGSALLVLSGNVSSVKQPLWSLPLPAGEARRLGQIDVEDARLFPDGRLLYWHDAGVFIAEKDGSNPRQLEALSKYSAFTRISPDGTRLGFIELDAGGTSWTVYEAAADGTGAHPILKSAPGLPTQACCLRWAEDGKHLIFLGSDGTRQDIWSLSDEKPLLSKTPSPVRLTNGPISYSSFAPSPDGKQIFAVGSQRRGELVRYDPGSQTLLPYLGGIPAGDPIFSRDGKWMSYTSYPDHALWRSRSDGSDALQLTYPPVVVLFPRISPDGSRVAYSDIRDATYVVGMDGGAPRRLMDKGSAPDWSPDSNLLTVTAFKNAGYEIRIIDLRDGKVSTVPNSAGMLGPWFVSQDALISAANNQSKLVRYDFKTQKWSDLISSSDGFVNWEVSADLKYLYYSTGGKDPTVFRLKLSDNAVEEVLKLKNIRMVNDLEIGPKLNVTPDNSVLLLRDIGTEEVYALSVKWR